MISNGYKNSYYYQPYYWMDNYYPEWGEYVAPSKTIYESIGMIRGLFNKIVTVYPVTESVSTTTGENIKTNGTAVTIKARVVPLTKNEVYRANKLNLEIVQCLYTDMSTAFDEGDRIYYDGNYYEITELKNFDEWDRYLRVNYKRVQ